MAFRDLIPGAGRKTSSLSRSAPSAAATTIPTRCSRNRLFDDVFRGFGVPAFVGLDRTAGWPHVELGETDKEIRVTAELPALDEKDVKITVEDSTLTLRGEKRSEVEDKDRGYTERSYSRFERRIGLPQGVDRVHADATFKNGVLTVNLPKAEAANENVRRLPVNGKAA